MFSKLMPKHRILYSCDKCAYKTTKKSNYDNHINRKTPCVIHDHNGVANSTLQSSIINDTSTAANDTSNDTSESVYECSYCNKQFAYKNNMYRHRKNCTSAVNTTSFVCNTNNGTINIDNRTNTTITNHITINAYGRENIDHILNDVNFIQRLKGFLRNGEKGLMTYIKVKHFDPDHPENNTIKKTNKKDNFIKTYDGSRWTMKLLKPCINNLLERVAHDYNIMLQCDQDGDHLISRYVLDDFMVKVGEVIGVDVTGPDYDYDYKLEEHEKRNKLEALGAVITQALYLMTKNGE
jgi:hypothetical protein